MKKCIVCGAKFFEKPLLEFDDMPRSAQNIPNESELNQDTGMTLRLYQCRGCGLVQFDCDPVNYYKDVIRSGGFTTTMVNLRKSQYSHLIEKYHLEKRKFLEVGCGQGEFLSILKEFPVEAYGIENKQELVDKAVSQGLNVFQGFVGDDKAVVQNGPYDVFLSFNFFEHQPDPNGMLQGIYNNLTDDGMGLITVPSLEYILEHNGYYELIHDHLVYYTFDTLRFVLEKNGFEVLEEEMINRDTLSMIVRKKAKINVLKIQDSYGQICKQVNDYVDGKRKEGKKVAFWGASHQGFTLAATAKLGGKIEYIIDSAPFKQGRFAPASHIPIISPEKAVSQMVDAIIIAAPGYTDEIAGIIQEKYGNEVEIAVMKTKELELYEDIKK
ncbi:MAG: methyltransferase domain-containing protein [Lachnospiraceae bacterium]|nr:methyltransferase domain-containing protein [Lachnospiraceae bacterium]